MKKINLQKTLAISGVIGGIILLNSTPAYATEIPEDFSQDSIEDVYSRISRKGQVVNVDSTFLRIRSSESTDSEILGTMKEGMIFDIISKNGQWYKIQFNNISGYVYGEYVEEVNSIANEILYEGTVYDAAPNLRVRSGASLSSSVIGYVTDNSKVSIVGVENEWYKIEYNNGYGYVHSDYVLIDENGSVDNDNSNSNINTVGYAYDLEGYTLRVRQSPSVNSNILGSLKEGEAVNIIGEEGNWYNINYNGNNAYVSKDYITLDKPSDSDSSVSGGDSSESIVINKKGQVINVENSNLRVRQAPSTNSLVLGYLLNNSIVDIISKEDNWYKISYRDSQCYVSADYIEIVEADSNNGNVNNGGETNGDAYNIIYNAVIKQVGAPYVWGGSGEELTTSSLNSLKSRFPYETSQGEYNHAECYVNLGYRAFDCSGLMQWGFAQAGIYIGRTTYQQIYEGIEVSLNDVIVGDLIFTSDLGHVGMYIGNDQWIESSSTGDFVRVRNVPWGYVGRARRVLN